MPKLFNRVSKKSGLPPGTLVHVGKKKVENVKISVIDYDEENFCEEELEKAEHCSSYKDKPTVTWINIDGLHDVRVVETVGKFFDLHPLVMEDILNTGQRPKIEDFNNYIFIVLKMISYGEEEGVEAEQVSLILGSNFVLSFQEKPGDVFGPVRERIKNSKGKIRKMGTDYLVYALVDSIVDNYFIVLEKIGEKIGDLEEELIKEPTTETLQTIHKIKTNLIFLRKSVWPLREVVNKIERGELALIGEKTGPYFRDVYDHTIQVIDTVETFRDMVSGMLDIYLSSISNKMNAVMKVLTIIATIFIPLTFIAGVYGMNFQYMPELGWRWGYFGILSIMSFIFIGMMVYFKKKKWL